MKTYIAFLRGINVSGQKRIKMADLKAGLRESGFKKAATYIQSGNLILHCEEQTITGIQRRVEAIILKYYGFKVPVLITTPKELQIILEAYPFKKAENKNQYFTLLYAAASKSLTQQELNKLEFSSEDFKITNACVYLNCKEGAGKAKLNTSLIESKLKVAATTRNLRTMQKMIELAI